MSQNHDFQDKFTLFIKKVDKKDYKSSFELLIISTILITIGFPGTFYAIIMGYILEDLTAAFLITNTSKIIGFSL